MNSHLRTATRSYVTGLAALLLAAGSGLILTRADGAERKPRITSLTVQPASLKLSDLRDARSIVVTGKTDTGYAVALQRHALPAVERAGHLDAHRHRPARLFGLPPENLGERRRAFGNRVFGQTVNGLRHD